MYYFLPAWSTEIPRWYSGLRRLEFDDSIHQLRIFQEEQIPTTIVLPLYMPHLRYFLHRQDIYETRVFNVFDAIQQIPEEPLSFPVNIDDFTWPEDVEFVYTPFLIIVRRDGRVYAHVHLNIEGFITDILFWDDQGQTSHQLILDDRGFISSRVDYEHNQPHLKTYLTPTGDWVLRQDLSEQGSVIVNPAFTKYFAALEYSSMDEIVAEVLRIYLLHHLAANPIFVLADSALNRNLLPCLPVKAPKIISLFSERNEQQTLQSLKSLESQVSFFVTDSKEVAEGFQDQLTKAIYYQPPYDTRLRLGSSQSRKESKIFYQLGQEESDENLLALLKIVASNPLLEVSFVSYNRNNWQVAEFEATLHHLIQEHFSEEDFLQEEVSMAEGENDLEENVEPTYRYQVVNLVDENQVFQELEHTRLVVDLSSKPMAYTQLAAISAGIPQINKVASPYVEHQKNGYVLNSLEDLGEVISYYTATLKPWNDTLIETIQKIREHTGRRFIERWQTWLKEN